MRFSILLIHICGGVAGMLSGAGAISFGKGSRWHALAGNVFFLAMLVMGSTAVYLGNVFGGLFACYLVWTAWLTAKRRNGETSSVDWLAMLFVLTFGVFILIRGVEAARNPAKSFNAVPPGML